MLLLYFERIVRDKLDEQQMDKPLFTQIMAVALYWLYTSRHFCLGFHEVKGLHSARKCNSLPQQCLV